MVRRLAKTCALWVAAILLIGGCQPTSELPAGIYSPDPTSEPIGTSALTNSSKLADIAYELGFGVYSTTTTTGGSAAFIGSTASPVPFAGGSTPTVVSTNSTAPGGFISLLPTATPGETLEPGTSTVTSGGGGDGGGGDDFDSRGGQVYAGTVSITKYEAVTDAAGETVDGTFNQQHSVRVEFADDGRMSGIFLYGWLFQPDQLVGLEVPGQTVTLSGTAPMGGNTYTYTVVVTLLASSFDASSASADLGLVLTGSAGNFREQGTGNASVRVQRSGSTAEFRSSLNWAMNWTTATGGIDLDVTAQYDLVGTIVRR
jgi:hypothetical protein